MSGRGPVVELVIESLGARGDGIARLGGDTYFVPYTIPGDRVQARIEGRRGDGIATVPMRILAAGPGRGTAACRHFGECGGCALQHLDPANYAAWKRDLLVEALRRAGCDPARVAPLVAIPPGTRRRAAMAFIHRRDGVALGFTRRASHYVVDMAECPVLAPPLIALIAPLRALLQSAIATGGTGDVTLTATETGVDLLIECDRALDLAAREHLAAFAESHDLARLSWRRPGADIEPVAWRRSPIVRFAGVAVEPPPGGFLQPAEEGERALAGLVTGAVAAFAQGQAPIADLYAGCGSFTFPLARLAPVHAVEGEGEALTALRRAAERSGRGVTVEARDLARRPLYGPELAPFAVVVFDPPRAGAAEQAKMLADAGPPLVIAVSCNPATLARDARLLVNGGYRLEGATPVDQFVWSARVEAVAVFRR